MAIDRRSFIGVGGAFLASGGLSAGAAEATRTPNGTVRVSQDVPVLGDYDVCVVGAGREADHSRRALRLSGRRRLELQGHVMA